LQFVDEARFVVRAGRGGDGSVSFNREKYKPRGGPDGGHGGDGGSVIFRATEDLQTLEPYAHRKLIKAGRGSHGSGNNRAGESGNGVVIDVPIGTLVYDEDGLLADLSEAGQEFVAARGGSGAMPPLSPRPVKRQPSGRRASPVKRERSASNLECSLMWGLSVSRTPENPPCSPL
jgi:GTP-binding protein